MATVEEIVGLLVQHRSTPAGSPHCACGWRPGLMLNDTESDRLQHVYHQAEMLAGLCPENRDIGTPSRARVEALCYLLVDEGHMTPMAKRQISRLWDES